MAQGLEFSDQILALVCDSLQVVSFKWLSRRFSISSNAAKRLLQEFVNKHGDSVEVVYAVSGWTKLEPRCYSVQLVPKTKLQQACEPLVDPVNSHIYSVQPCIPKDPAELWSVEYVQAEELFNEPPNSNNCLRDNRFSAISCLSATRSLEGTASGVTPSSPSKTTALHPSATIKPPISQGPDQPVPPDVPIKVTELNTKATKVDAKDADKGRLLHLFGPKVAGTDTNVGKVIATTGPAPKVTAGAPVKSKAPSGPGQAGGSLASLWNRAPAKPKPISPKDQKEFSKQQPLLPGTGDAEARIRALEAVCDASSDDDAVDFARIRRGRLNNGSGRKRRVVFDDELSDAEKEEMYDSQEVISLASPELPKQRFDSTTELIGQHETGEVLDGNSDRPGEGNLKAIPMPGRKNAMLPSATPFTGFHDGQLDAKVEGNGSADEVKSGKVSHTHHSKPVGGQVQRVDVKLEIEAAVASDVGFQAKTLPKKRKVLRTHMDDRGREVTEVVWEVEDGESQPKVQHLVKTPSATVQIEECKPLFNRSVASGNAKSPSLAQVPTNKSSGKPPPKASGKDSQQGKIMSFFKKKN